MTTSFVQSIKMDAITDQCKFEQLGSRSMATCNNKDTLVSARTTLCEKLQLVLGQKAVARKEIKVLIHARPATILAVAPVETEATNRAGQTPLRR